MSVLADLHEDHKKRVNKIKTAAFKELVEKPKEIRYTSTSNLIIDVVAEYYKVSRNDILSQRRDASTVKARQMVCYMMYLATKYTNPQIGSFLDRDATTVHHALKKIRAKKSRHQEAIDALEPRIKKLISEKKKREADEALALAAEFKQGKNQCGTPSAVSLSS